MKWTEVLKLFKKVDRYMSLDSLSKYQMRRLASAENKLRTEYARAAKRANTRLRALEKAGLESSSAYMRATWFTGETRDKMRFSESKKLDIETMRTAFEEVNIFLQSPTSRTSVEKRRRSGIDKIMMGAGEKAKNAMMRFLSSTAFGELKKIMGTDIVRKGADAIEAGASVSKLNQLFSDFINREKAGDLAVNQDIYTEVWSAWTGENQLL